MEQITSSPRLAIRCYRRDLIAPNEIARIEREMGELGTRLGRAVDLTTVVIDPAVAGPWATVGTAIALTHATDVIVPDLEHVDGIEYWIRQHAQLITLEGERVLKVWGPLEVRVLA